MTSQAYDQTVRILRKLLDRAEAVAGALTP